MPKRHEPRHQPYGSLVQLNTERLILDAVGPEAVQELVDDYLDMLQTSSAVYERNGDYAAGILSSGWCRALDNASRNLCETDDNRVALQDPRWHCHQACWKVSKQAMAEGKAVDHPCPGGLRMHAEPIMIGDEAVGVVNFGYGEPPLDDPGLAEIAERYGVPLEELRKLSEAENPRPAEVVESAKRRARANARLVAEIVRRRQVEEDLKQALEEKEVLFGELTHRVKNNLQMIASLLSLQVRSASNESIRKPLQDAYARISLVSKIHEHLYTSGAYSSIDISKYIQELASDTFEAYCKSGEVTCSFSGAGAGLEMTTSKAVPLALVASELMINALKYAFPRGSSGRISVSVEARKGGDTVSVSIEDDGVGLPDQFDHATSDGYGMRIVNALVHQLEGEMRVERLEPGTRFEVLVPVG